MFSYYEFPHISKSRRHLLYEFLLLQLRRIILHMPGDQKFLQTLPEIDCSVLWYQGLWSCWIIMKLVFRCYFIYRLVEGFATADEVAKSIRPKLIGFTALSILYDLPRAYLNVNLFGSLCSFYYNVLIYVNGSFSYRYKRGMSTHRIVLLIRLNQQKTQILAVQPYWSWKPTMKKCEVSNSIDYQVFQP